MYNPRKVTPIPAEWELNGQKYRLTGVQGNPYIVTVINDTTKVFKDFCGYELAEKLKSSGIIK